MITVLSLILAAQAALDKANEGQIRGIADDVRSRSASSGN
jgi:hypothetical protein